MQRSRFYLIAIVFLILVSFSCSNSPSSRIVGQYDGNYSRDSVVVGTASVEAIEVNPLTVNFVVTLDSVAPFSVSGVQVNGGGLPYSLYSNGSAGMLSGVVTSQDMVWTLMSSSDTISFYGVKL